jgi:hypothetical protein
MPYAPGEISYYGQNPDFGGIITGKGAEGLRCHSFLNIGLEFPDLPWDGLLSVGAAHVDYTGFHSCLAALICGHMDRHIPMYLASLPAGLLLHGRPTVERVLDLWYRDDQERALAVLNEATGFGAPNDGEVDVIRSPSTITEAAFFCVAYHPDNAHLDYLLRVQRFTLYQRLTLYRMANREDDFQRTYASATREATHHPGAYRLAEAAARLSVQKNREADREEYAGVDLVLAHMTARQKAMEGANDTADWCRMAVLDSMYRPRQLPYDRPWLQRISSSALDLVQKHLQHAEEAARCSVDWRLCGQTIACCLGDHDRVERCFARAEESATTAYDVLGIFRLRQRSGIGQDADLARLVARAEEMAMHHGDWSECADAWRDIGEVGRYRMLRRRLRQVDDYYDFLLEGNA